MRIGRRRWPDGKPPEGVTSMHEEEPTTIQQTAKKRRGLQIAGIILALLGLAIIISGDVAVGAVIGGLGAVMVLYAELMS